MIPTSALTTEEKDRLAREIRDAAILYPNYHRLALALDIDYFFVKHTLDHSWQRITSVCCDCHHPFHYRSHLDHPIRYGRCAACASALWQQQRKKQK